MTHANHYAAELIERIDVSASLAIFRFRPAEQPSFIAGQFAAIGLVIDGDLVELRIIVGQGWDQSATRNVLG